MNVSKLVNAPIRLVSSCLQTVSQNKKTIAIATAGVASVAVAAAILYNNRKNLYYIQDSLVEVAETAKLYSAAGGGKSIGTYVDIRGTYVNIRSDIKCLPSYTPYKLEVELSKSAPDVTGLLDQVKALYNNATSYGTDIFSSYGFYATRDPAVLDSDRVKATFLICRSSFSNLFSAPWRR